MQTLVDGFLQSLARFPERNALEVDGRALTYNELNEHATRLAATLLTHAPDDGNRLTAVFGYRSVTAFGSILAALMRGHGYVPLNPSFPVERTRAMLENSQCTTVIVDRTAVEQLEPVIGSLDRPLLVVVPDLDDVTALSEQFPKHAFLGSSEIVPAPEFTPTQVDTEAIAYLLFTSGSTGRPKGVMVTNANATHFLKCVIDRYLITEQDRLTQMFDMTFDLSVFDMFVAWSVGACVCCPSDRDRMTPAGFIDASKVTIWFSVPSAGVLMNRLRMLEPGAFPHLRLSLFCGEALPQDLVMAWEKAAPNSVIENLYGPTELTIACAWYRWDAERSPQASENGIVPIGEAFPSMEYMIVDPSLQEVAVGADGELLMTGPQMCPGYWNDADKTAAAFVIPPGKQATYYRTGDRVRRSSHGEPMVYLGRTDQQIQIQGFRVELGEVESVMKEAAGAATAIAIGWPRTPGGASGIVGFVDVSKEDTADVLQSMKSRLPSYMVPSQLRLVSDFPLNANGKIDRKALLNRLETND